MRGRAPRAVFDDANLVSFAGLAPVMALAERAGLSELIGERVQFDPTATKVKSGGGEPGREADLDHRRDGRRRGLHRRSGRDPLRRDEAAVRRGVRGGHVGSVPARVHPRPHPAAGVGAAGPSGQPGRAHAICCPASSSGRSSISTRCCGRCSATPSRAPASGTPRSPASRCCAAACPRWSTTISTEPRRAGDRRDPAARRQGRLRQGRGVDGGRGDPHRPRRRRGRRDPGPRRLAPTATAPWSAPASRPGPGSPWC